MLIHGFMEQGSSAKERTSHPLSHQLDISYHLRHLLQRRRSSHEACTPLQSNSLGPIVVDCIPCSGSWPEAALPAVSWLQKLREGVGRRETAPPKRRARRESRAWKRTTLKVAPGSRSTRY
jgi:hypothetical protein